MPSLVCVDGELQATTVETRPTAIATRANFKTLDEIHEDATARDSLRCAVGAAFVEVVGASADRVVTTVTPSSDVPRRRLSRRGQCVAV
jgi:hypothetical protein